MPEKESDPMKAWFAAAEDTGEYIGIRFGRIPPGAHQPEWTFLRHADYDGIGAFAVILRRGGASLSRLAQIKHPSNPSWLPFIKSLPKLLKPRHPLKWRPMGGETSTTINTRPPSAVAWHIFDEPTTIQVRRACRKGGVTVNSFLLKHLTKAIRPYLEDESSMVPWMILVNLRGKIVRESDTTNYASVVGVKVCSYETVRDIHQKIYNSLARGEHWANWYGYKVGCLIGHEMKKRLITTGQCMPEWYLGSFSNLGDWDPEKKITQTDCEGGWLFCPPVLRCQSVGAGCVTFQNRLSLMIQTHPELTTNSAVPQAWVQNWVKEIELDLSSVLSDPVAISLPSLAA